MADIAAIFLFAYVLALPVLFIGIGLATAACIDLIAWLRPRITQAPRR